MTLEFKEVLGVTTLLAKFKGNGYYASGRTKADCITKLFDIISPEPFVTINA